MTQITFILPDGTEKVIDAADGLSIMEVALKNNIEKIEGACGGSLACATCHVYVHPDWWNKVLPDDGEVSEAEEDMLDLAFHLKKQSRLSCQIIVRPELNGLVLALPGTPVNW